MVSGIGRARAAAASEWGCASTWKAGRQAERGVDAVAGSVSPAPLPRRGRASSSAMGNAGSMDSQHTDFKAHHLPLKLPMPEPTELEERFAVVLVSE